MEKFIFQHSGNLVDAHYENDTLTIQFKGGGQYEYANVPYSVFASLKAAPSPGKYFHSNIKNNYITTKV